MKKATIVLFVLFFGFFFLPGVSFACGGHGHDGAGGHHEMMQPEGPGGEGHVCPCHEADSGQDAPADTIPIPSPSKPEMKSGQSARDMFQHHPGFGDKDNGHHGEGHVCQHHK